MEKPIISISGLNKVYSGGFQALKSINLDLNPGEIFALLGPNGAGKTTLISTICGITTPTSGEILVGGMNILSEFRKTRNLIGLVPQELTTDAFETVWNTVGFSRGLFGKKSNPAYIEDILKRLSLWDKKDNRLMELSGGMKRRVMIAKALSHEPRILFLDEPTAGVDVELRKDMWNQVRDLQGMGVTIILTTHYIEEAEQMADRVGVISNGSIILVEEKEKLMKKMSHKELTLTLKSQIEALPSSLDAYSLKLDGNSMTYTYDPKAADNSIFELLGTLRKENIVFQDLETKQSSLEEIFVELVKQ